MAGRAAGSARAPAARRARAATADPRPRGLAGPRPSTRLPGARHAGCSALPHPVAMPRRHDMTRSPAIPLRPTPLRSLAACAALAAALGTAAPATAFPLISEVFYDAVGSDDGLSFVEIHGTPGTVLDGWVLEHVNGANGEVAATLALVGVIGPSSLYVVADRFADGTTAVPFADLLLNF